MRKLVPAYLILQWLTIFFLGFVLMYFELPNWTLAIVLSSAFISLVMIIPLGNIKWHMSHEQMVADQKESSRVTRNASKLIDVIKRNAFKKDILTKEDANKILNRTYEETLND